MKTYITKVRLGAATLSLGTALAGTSAIAAQVFATDLIVQGSACIGFDCTSSESFGFDTLRLKENNLRIHFEDTSGGSGSFPSNDWRIFINDSSNGGANYFAIQDATNNRIPFRIEANAPNNTLYVEGDGDVGVGTANPVVKLHIVKGDSPAVRLEQDGSSGFTPQTWDLAGNETNFFVRDVTNGSKLPFRIKPSAPDDSVFIAADGDIGLGTDNPSEPLHLRRTSGTAKILVEEASTTTAARQMGVFRNNGNSFISLETTAAGAATPVWNLGNLDGELRLVNAVGSSTEFALTNTGDLTIAGTITTTGGTCGGGCDLVFDKDHERLSIEEHAALMWENKYLPNVGPTPENAPINVSDKLGRMLNELEYAHIYIDQQDDKLQSAQARISTLEMRLEALESKFN